MELFTDIINIEYLELLENKLMFSGMDKREIFDFIRYAAPFYVKLYEGQSMRLEKEYSHLTGMIITGRTHIYSVGYDGTKSLLRSLKEGDHSGMLYSMLDYRNTLIEFDAYSDCEMLFFRPETILIAEESVLPYQQKILVNLIASQRNMFYALTEHIACLSQRTIRKKVMRFLRYCSDQAHSYELDLPFSREEMADYLAVDRSALSRELSAMRGEGIIDFCKNKFTILSRKDFDYIIPEKYYYD